MSDVYATINEVTPETQRRLADILEERAANPRMQEMFRAYLSNIDFPSDAKVLEIGCGTGAVTRILAKWPGVVQAVGVDPSAVFIAKAHSLAQGIPNITFQEGDGRSLTISADTFDVVVVNTTLTHVPQPERLVTKAGIKHQPCPCFLFFHLGPSQCRAVKKSPDTWHIYFYNIFSPLRSASLRPLTDMEDVRNQMRYFPRPLRV